jgi:hypothetical protein
MGEIKTPWPDKDQIFTGTSVDGAGVVSRGSDPNADGGLSGEAAIKDFWEPTTYPLGGRSNILPENPSPSTAESANSVSGLPALPNRFEPSESITDIPDLTDRSPGTIDKQ